MTYDEIREKIVDELAVFKAEDGTFNLPFYFDFEDGLPVTAVQSILAAENPEETYNRIFKLRAINQHLSQQLLFSVEKYNFDLLSFIDNNVQLIPGIPDLSEFKDWKTNVDIIVDTGDANYDYALNSFANERYYDLEEIDLNNHSALFWLAEQQGVSKEDLYKVAHGESMLPKEINDLREVKTVLRERLQEYGFSPFGKSYYHNVAEKYMKAIKPLEGINYKINKLKETIKSNSVTFEEFRNKYIDSPKLQGMNEEYFKILKERTLDSNYATLGKYQAEKKTVELSIIADPQLKIVHSLVQEYNEAQKKYDDAIKAIPDLANKAFLAEDIVNESRNTTTGMNALTFCVSMSLAEAIELNKVIQEEKPLNNFYNPDKRTGESFITLSKDANVGLYDPWNGAGSDFGIRLTKDVVLPVKFIDTANIDDYRGYSLNDIYGEMEYTESLVDISRVSVKTLENVIGEALKRSVNNINEENKLSSNKNHDEERV